MAKTRLTDELLKTTVAAVVEKSKEGKLLSKREKRALQKKLQEITDEYLKNWIQEAKDENEKSREDYQKDLDAIYEGKVVLNPSDTVSAYIGEKAFQSAKELAKRIYDQANNKIETFEEMLWKEYNETKLFDASVRKVVNEAIKKNYKILEYADSKRKINIDAALRSRLKTMINQQHLLDVEEMMVDYDTGIVQVTSHAGARIKCYRDQGNLYDKANGEYGSFTGIDGVKYEYKPFEQSSYGAVDGLLGNNCKHRLIPVIKAYFKDVISKKIPSKTKNEEQAKERAIAASNRNKAVSKKLYKEIEAEANVK